MIRRYFCCYCSHEEEAEDGQCCDAGEAQQEIDKYKQAAELAIEAAEMRYKFNADKHLVAKQKLKQAKELMGDG